MSTINPKPIGGFPEWLPEEKILELRLLDIIRSNFERYGFSPIETSAVERQRSHGKRRKRSRDLCD